MRSPREPMMPSRTPDTLAAAFQRFANAVKAANVAEYRALSALDVPSQDALFLANAAKVRLGSWTMQLRRAVEEGDVATVEFQVMDATGRPVDDAQMTWTWEPEGWRIRSL